MSPPDVSEPAKVSAPLLHEGELLGGRYQIERCLGGGGMASVYRAMHVGLDQPVAVKVVSPLIREVPGVVSRFMREARAATRLKGEHVVRVFDVGTTDDGAPYMVMELLEGRDLGQLLDEGFRPTLEEAVDYVLQACEALAEVHGLGIVHRDLKPANLFVTRGPDGLVCIKLIDFGISRVDSPLSPKDAVALTNPDVVMGSPRYMPPEQMESSATADSRSDIWGLGAILYEMLVGNAPFDGDSLFDIYAATVRAPAPAPSSLRSELPEEIDAVLLKCLRVDPADRYADVAELATALAPFGEENAAVRAESIARVLDASRARGQGADEAPIGSPVGPHKNSSSSRIRRRASPSVRATRRRRVAVFAVCAIALVGIGVAAAPIARHFHISPSVSVTGAAAATQGSIVAPPSITPAMPPVEPEPIPTAPSTAPSPSAQSEREATPTDTGTKPTAAAAPARRATAAAPPRSTTSPSRPPTPSSPPSAETKAPQEPTTSDLAPEPASPARAQTPRGDDRTLFEERK